MNNFCSILLPAAILFMVSLPGWAEGEESPWSGKIAVGYLAVSGNTESTSFSVNAETNWDGERWHHQLLGKMLAKSEDKDTTAEAYKAAYEAKFDLSERTYLFGLLDYNKDRFSSYDQQIFEVAGVGQRFINTDKHKLNGELGVGSSQSTLVLEQLPPAPTIRTRENEVTYSASGDYKWMISDNATFSQKLSVLSGSNNTYTESISELSAGIIGSLSTVLGYTVKHNSDVTVGKDKTDTYASVSLEYVF